MQRAEWVEEVGGSRSACRQSRARGVPSTEGVLGSMSCRAGGSIAPQTPPFRLEPHFPGGVADRPGPLKRRPLTCRQVDAQELRPLSHSLAQAWDPILLVLLDPSSKTEESLM